MRGRVSVIYKITDEEFIDLVKKSGSLCEVVRYFGLSINGSGGFVVVKRRIKKLNIDCSHIAKSIKEKRRRNFILNHAAPLNSILVENSTYTNTFNLKKKLISYGLLSNNCSICKINNWNGEYLSLQIDHVNGNKTDNRIENLRLLCPNCHSQTITYAGKKNQHTKNNCSNCNLEIATRSKSGMCQKCYLDVARRRNVIKKILDKNTGIEIDRNELEQSIISMGWEATGRKYGVSGNAIKKWARKYDIHIASQREFKLSISSSVCADFKNNKMSLKELAKKYKTSTHTVKEILLDNNLIEKNPEKKYKYGCPGITYDSNRGDYACYIKNKFLRRGFKKAEEAIEHRNNVLNNNG